VITSPGIIDIGEERAQIEDGVTAVALDLERYQYDVLIDSTVRLQLDLDRATYFAGDPIGVSARLTAGGRPVTGASVALSTTAPARSAANFLAAAKVPADALEQAKERLSGQDATPILVKSLGAQLAGLAFEGGTRSVKQTMVDRDGVGVYTATFTATSTPELYTFYVTATGVTEEGVAFRREASLETHVLVQPDPRFTLIDVNHLGAGHAEIIVLPRDQFLNAFLANTDTAGGFGLVVRDANLAGPLVSNLDGTYTQPLTFDPGKAPAIGVQFGGKDVVEPERIAPVADLRYADRVVEFSPGPVQLANRHADPKAALGSIVDKPADRFVSLGAGGGLTVAARKFLILPHHDSDVTVFVHRDTELRSYRVEAYSIKHKQWVSLGESIGITRSFALRAAGLQRTPAIRVVDTSLRARDDVTNLPLETPGVSVSAVGFGRTTSDRDLREQVESVPDWLPWNLDEDDDE
jgi:hypothetical protein